MLANAAIVLVIALGAITALLALRSKSHRVEETSQIDHRLAIIDRLRAESRELGQSARRYILSGDLKEQQRVLSIVHEMKKEREQLGARVSLEGGALLEADLDEYIAALKNAMWFDDKDPIVRLSRFEDELAKIRVPLSVRFEDVISRERSRRDVLRSAHWLARSARWAVLVASLLGAGLVIGSVVGVLRKLASPSLETTVASARSGLRRERLETADLVGQALDDHRNTARERGIRLRFEMPPSVTVVADRERIGYVLDSLFAIAIDSARPNAELVVHIATARGDIRFAIIEPGPGLEPSSNYDAALQVCEQVIEAHGGRFGVQTSSISRTYWFALPIEPAVLR